MLVPPVRARQRRDLEHAPRVTRPVSRPAGRLGEGPAGPRGDQADVPEAGSGPPVLFTGNPRLTTCTSIRIASARRLCLYDPLTVVWTGNTRGVRSDPFTRTRTTLILPLRLWNLVTDRTSWDDTRVLY